MTPTRGVEVDVVILTALSLEYDAVRGRLTDIRRHTDAGGTRYEIGTLSPGAGRVALALIGEGNLAAAAVTGRAIDELVPKAVILVGVAGGLTDSINLGDVVVATRVHAYHGGRDEPTGFRPRPKSWPLAHALEQAAREVARTNTWGSSLSTTPAVHFKAMISGEVVIDTRESPLARLIADHYGDAVAADMESAGIAEAAHRVGFPNTITVRGISDKTDGHKRRADAAGWQFIGAAHAAAFAVALAERIIQAPPPTRIDHATGQPAHPTSRAQVHAGGSVKMRHSVIAGGNVTQSRTVRIGLGGAAAAVVVATALVLANQDNRGTDPVSPPQRGKIVTQDNQIIAESDPRRYPHGPRYAAITGFLSPFYGSAGIERAGDEALKAGNTMVVTIDSRTQQAVYDALTNRRGAAVAIHPQTGEILAMVSTPSFDPNLLTTHDNATAKQAHQQLLDDPGAPLLNRTSADTYFPGSTFTLVVAAAALEDGGDKSTEVTAVAGIDVRTGQSCPPGGHGACLANFSNQTCGDGATATLERALERSCNTAFAKLANDLGEDKVRQQAAKFGVGEAGLTVPLPVVPSCIGVPGACMDVSDRLGALYQTGVGQADVRLTPLQNAMIVATIANSGTRMRPHLIKHGPEPLGRAMTDGNAAALRDMMIRAENVTGGSGKNPDVRIASKTATAQTGGDPRTTPPVSWYIAFAPAENPTIAIAVVLEDRQDAATGGTAAASIGRTIINQGLK